eukprot:scaffold14005_cov30-Tisochrysis_lutea.AAC.3
MVALPHSLCAGIEPAMLEQVELAANKIDPFREANLAVVNDGLSPRRGPDEGVSPLSLSPPQPRTNSMRKSGSTSHVPTVHFAAQPSACAHLSAPAGGGGYFALAAAHLAQPTNALVRSPLLSALPSPIARNVSDEAAGALLARLDEMTAAGRKIVLEVDEVERLKGLPLALLGWEQMLRTAKRDVRATFVQPVVSCSLSSAQGCALLQVFISSPHAPCPTRRWASKRATSHLQRSKTTRLYVPRSRRSCNALSRPIMELLYLWNYQPYR